MGTWGYRIDDDDVAADVYAAYLAAHDTGGPHPKILATLKKDWRAEIDGEEADAVSFWIGVARAQWECGTLTAAVKSTLARAVGRGHAVARRGEADTKRLARRQKALKAFLAKLGETNRRPRKSAPPAGATSLGFAVGDCVAVELGRNDWGAFVVIEAIALRRKQAVGLGDATVAVIRYRSATPPTIKVFEGRKWLVRSDYGLPAEPLVVGVLARKGDEKLAGRTRVVGKLKLRRSDPNEETSAVNGWGTLIEMIDESCPRSRSSR